MSSPLPWGMGDAYDVCGASMCPWDMEGGVGTIGVLPSSLQLFPSSEKGGEAGSDPRGHLGVTWGVYLCAGKPPLADIILSHPPDLTRCDSVIGLAIPAMSGHIQYRGAASGDLYIGISGINRVLLSQCFRNFPAFRSDGQCIGDRQLARDFALTDWLTVISRYFGGYSVEGSDFISEGFVASAIF